jgi:hypothetical protein
MHFALILSRPSFFRMHSSQSFPFEIITVILNEIDLEDETTTLQCQLTCKLWNQLVNKRIHRCVDLSDSRHYYGKFTLRILQDPSIGEMVREIRFNRWTDDFDIYAIYCPNLVSLICESGSTNYLKKLRRKLYYGAWPKMDTIQHPGIFMSDYSVYAELAWLLRDRLTALFIFGESFFTEQIDDDHHQQLTESLASFQKLQSVDFELFGKHIFEYDPYIDACPLSLERVKITSYVSPKVLLNNSDFQSRAICQPLEHIRQWPQIKQLSVNIAIANDDSLLYIMHKFPSLLEFELNVGTENQLGYLNKQLAVNLSRQTLVSFLFYLSCIPNCFIDKFYIKLLLKEYS